MEILWLGDIIATVVFTWVSSELIQATEFRNGVKIQSWYYEPWSFEDSIKRDVSML